jgi:hypothetical protein
MSDACIVGNHLDCNDPKCQCACHNLKIGAEELEALKNKVGKKETDALEKFLGKYVATEVD